MANIKSAEKKNRQRLRRRVTNIYHLTTMRTALKKVRAAVSDKDLAAAQAALAAAIPVIDKTSQRGAIKKQTAARHKSRLTLAVNGIAA